MIQASVPPFKNFTTNTKGSRPHLDYLDGLRGLAALYVAIFHIYTEVNYRWLGGDLPHRVWLSAQWMVYGHSAVAVFIVLSGYCLMLPVARAESGQLQGGIASFMKRRALRIFPPYYASLLLSIVMLVLTQKWQGVQDTFWNFALPGLKPSVILTHLFLVHNFSQAWIMKINPPLWSVAVEFQIYLVFALILLPIWRRHGTLTTLGAAFLLGLLPHYLLPSSHNFDWSCPWYIGLFALGMAGACINFSLSPLETSLREKTPWGVLSVFLMIVFLITRKLHLILLPEVWEDDTNAGLSTIFLIIFCTRASLQSAAASRPLILRLLAHPALVKLGAFSYSLYLIHQPLEALFYLGLHSVVHSPTMRLCVMIVICLPLVVFCAYLFHLAFERPFLHSRNRKIAEIKPLELVQASR